MVRKRGVIVPVVRKRKQRRRLRRKRGNRNMTFVNPMYRNFGFSNEYITKVKWSSRPQSVTGATMFWKYYRLNGAYDPDMALDTHYTPYYWSVFDGLYWKYTVLASKIRVFITPRNGGNAGSNLACTIIPASEILDSNDPQVIMSYPFRKNLFTQFYKGRTVVKYYMPCNVLAGIPKVGIRIDDRYSAFMNSTPSNEFVWNLVVRSMNTNDINVDYSVDITYYVRFFDKRLDINQTVVDDDSLPSQPMKGYDSQEGVSAPIDAGATGPSE